MPCLIFTFAPRDFTDLIVLWTGVPYINFYVVVVVFLKEYAHHKNQLKSPEKQIPESSQLTKEHWNKLKSNFRSAIDKSVDFKHETEQSQLQLQFNKFRVYRLLTPAEIQGIDDLNLNLENTMMKRGQSFIFLFINNVKTKN